MRKIGDLASCVLLNVIFLSQSVSSQCAEFVFPDLGSGRVVTAPENSTLTLRFRLRELDGSCFRKALLFNVSVYEGDVNVCEITHYDGVFSTQQGPCRGTSEQGELVFSKTATRSDNNMELIFRASKVALGLNVTLNITYPPAITAFTLAGDREPHTVVVDQGEPRVPIDCRWAAGNPPSVGRLFRYKSGRKELLTYSERTSTSVGGTVVHASCSDAGIFGCEVGSVISTNRTLLVRCAPEVVPVTGDVTVSEGGAAVLRFSVRSYTDRFSFCKLTQHSASREQRKQYYDCKTGNESYRVSGSPPDLTVTVELPSVTIQDNGAWRLTLGNEKGSGTSPDFLLRVLQSVTYVRPEQGEVQVSEGDKAVLRFSVQSYTDQFLLCMLTQQSAGREGRQQSYDCKTGNVRYEVSGSPPDLTVTVELPSVGIQDNGAWRLTLDNGMGSGTSPSVLLRVLQTGEESEKGGEREEKEESFVKTRAFIIIMAAVSLVVAVGVIVAVTVMCVGKGKCAQHIVQRPEAVPFDVIPARPRDPRAPVGRDFARPNDYLEPVSALQSRDARQPMASAPTGPYASLRASDMGLRSQYSHFRPAAKNDNPYDEII